MKQFVENRIKFLLLPLVIIAVGVVMYFVHGGFNFDIEFMGGIRMEVDMGKDISNDEISDAVSGVLSENGIEGKVTVQKSGESGNHVVIKTPPVEEEMKTTIFNELKEKYSLSDEAMLSVSSASASFGLEVQQKALLYTLLAILCILVYIAIRFEWRSAVMAVMALALNVLVMAAVYTITNIPLNTTFIAAMLTVVGYSINNTIVIFDRIRENMKFRKKNVTVTDLVNRSILETMGRTINSTITTLITIVLIYILGVSSIKEFALPLIIGIAIGAYTSIFIASTFWAVWRESAIKAKAQAALERKNSKKK
ncbi:MAG TPA: protein translocase subunit SecF [Candidatus Ornithomonoglobus intestinigallinarum]|jgi:preprotein translocase subunit SecF|uniref:Protein-export membrane protein SecF n=1 Tax=Candidatus Ornithomonoglobus intestinigallinarum TaxID=2840894 RepID=A0A9D1H3U3_9FIRM|nr:protein translocase subunit SecF [Candidatus Ornithomonoglobus intestinigallinarum]